jgi:prepilin-type processing-associated H-X9-DG protein
VVRGSERGSAVVRGQHRRLAGITLAEGLVLAGLLALIGAALRPSKPSTPEQMCMANMRQILTAIRMYIADNDNNLPPYEVEAERSVYLRGGSEGGGPAADAPGKRRRGSGEGVAGEQGLAGLLDLAGDRHARLANPYLRWPVILDPYLEDRGVWRCPEALLEHPASFITGDVNWRNALESKEAAWDQAVQFLAGGAWPPGWGGDVTDSIRQSKLASKGGPTEKLAPAGVFVQSIAVNTAAGRDRSWRKADQARYVICADGGAQVDTIMTGTLAFPDICALECANEHCGWVDWEECTWAADCGLYNHAPSDGSFLRNPELRAPYSRHRGGVNIGFLDGHAEWIHSERVLALSPTDRRAGELLGYGPSGMTSDAPAECREDVDGEVPTLY